MWSKGICWIDDCRIPFVDEKDMMKPTIAKRDEFNDYKKTEGRENIRQGGGFIKQSNTQGRFPANILVSDDMLNDGLDRKGFSGGGGPTRFANATGGVKLEDYNYYKDKGSSSRYYDIDKWFEKILNYE